jgi:catechol 2,3-dioxygenase-like lactoylglutathione lyase family enzyme
MLGDFLELSIWSRDIAASVAFWERLGFRHGLVGDTWKHRYAVLSDGHLHIGLHEYEFDSPSLTWVRKGLAEALPGLAALELDFDFAKTGRDEFHEAGFRDPAAQVVTLLEARTWSAGPVSKPGGGLCGYFLEYRYPADDPAGATAFWERLGLVVDREPDPPRAIATGIILSPCRELRGPELVFEHEDPVAAAQVLQGLGYAPETEAGEVFLPAPDGLAIRILRA